MFEARQRPDISDQPKPAVPAANECHTTPIGDIKGFANCLNQGLASCPYRKPFGYGHLCYHPNWRQFAAPAKK